MKTPWIILLFANHAKSAGRCLWEKMHTFAWLLRFRISRSSCHTRPHHRCRAIELCLQQAQVASSEKSEKEIRLSVFFWPWRGVPTVLCYKHTPESRIWWSYWLWVSLGMHCVTLHFSERERSEKSQFRVSLETENALWRLSYRH